MSLEPPHDAGGGVECAATRDGETSSGRTLRPTSSDACQYFPFSAPGIRCLNARLLVICRHLVAIRGNTGADETGRTGTTGTGLRYETDHNRTRQDGPGRTFAVLKTAVRLVRTGGSNPSPSASTGPFLPSPLSARAGRQPTSQPARPGGGESAVKGGRACGRREDPADLLPIAAGGNRPAAHSGTPGRLVLRGEPLADQWAHRQIAMAGPSAHPALLGLRPPYDSDYVSLSHVSPSWSKTIHRSATSIRPSRFRSYQGS